ncbi:MAG: hypothetical protein HQM10_02685 [Candidatus Riflebacteria bacterium]|nr:hypothetical protein [Candidatus Riflebacteria bacterium]
MNKNTFVLAIFLIASCAYCGEIQTIRLLDNSEIKGEILEMKNGSYLIKTQSLGEMKIPASNVSAILSDSAVKSQSAQTGNSAIKIIDRAPNAGETNSQPKVADDQKLKNMQKHASDQVQSMMMNGDFIQNVVKLGESEEMQQVLSDPELMQAIQSCDYENLMNNPKMQQLMGSEQVGNILGTTRDGAE